MKKLKLFQLLNEISGHESKFAQTLREYSGGPLALFIFVNPPLSNPSASDPFGAIPPVEPTCPTPPVALVPQVSRSHMKIVLVQKKPISNFIFNGNFQLCP